MAYKTRGYKTVYKDNDGYVYDEFTVCCAVESVSDVCTYKMFNIKGEEVEITISAEYDTSYGNNSLIDVLHNLKYGKSMRFPSHSHDIVIEEMTDEETNKIFGR